MTIDVIAPTVRNPISGIGPYALGWPYYADTVTAAVEIDGVVTDLDPIYFSVTPTASTTSGNLYLTPDTALLYAGKILVISRRTPPEQGWQATQGERETGLETQLDRIVMLQQEQAGQLAGTLRVSGAVVAPLIPEAGRSILWDGTKFAPGPIADEIANAQSYAERAELAAGALTSLTDRVPYSFLITAGNSGRGPYALPYDPGAVDLIDLYINGLMQSSADHFEIVVMPAAASGKGLQFLDDQVTGHRVDLKFALPLGYDPAVNTAMDFATLADFQAAVTAGLTRVNGRTVIAAGTEYVAETGAALAGIPAGWRPVDWVYSREELEAATWEVAPGRNVLFVLESGIISPYRRVLAATDLIAGDLSEWEKAGLNAADAVQIGLDVALAAAVVTTADVYATYDGTANAITLATGKPFTAVPTGARIRFRATAANTTTTTISVDGLPAITAKTQTGANLPAGHIRTGVEMVATFDGTNWIVTRAISWGGTLNPTMLFLSPGTSTWAYTTRGGWWRREGNLVTYAGYMTATPTKGTGASSLHISPNFLDEAGASVSLLPVFDGAGAGVVPVLLGTFTNWPAPTNTVGSIGEIRHDTSGRIQLAYITLSGGILTRSFYGASQITDALALTVSFSGSFVVAP